MDAAGAAAAGSAMLDLWLLLQLLVAAGWPVPVALHVGRSRNSWISRCVSGACGGCRPWW